MKNTILLLVLLFSSLLYSQETDTLAKSPAKPIDEDFFDHLKIGQSMETIDQRGEPAQAVITFPKDKSESYLINLGASYQLNSKHKLISKIKVEFHKNTLTDEEQDNLEVGYQGTWKFSKNQTYWFLTFDPKYVYDGVSITNSVASNFLFSYYSENTRFNFNNNNYIKSNGKKIISYSPSLFVGAQVQENIKSENTDLKGFILRPLATASFSFTFLRKEEKFIKYSITYTGRKDIVNSTKIDEGYTKLLKTGIEFFIPNKALELSLGMSYNTGSDPQKGLANQEYCLISFNIHK